MKIPTRTEIEELLRHFLLNSGVESFGISHQFLFIEFRNNQLGDYTFSVDANVHILPEMTNKEALSQEEYELLCFNKVNLKEVIDLEIDINDNLILSFSNDIKLFFVKRDELVIDSVWMFAPSYPKNAFTQIRFEGDGYSIWGDMKK